VLISAADLPELVSALGDIQIRLAVILGMSALSWQAHAARPKVLPALNPSADIRHSHAVHQANIYGIWGLGLTDRHVAARGGWQCAACSHPCSRH